MKKITSHGSRLLAPFASALGVTLALLAAAPAVANDQVEPFSLLAEPGSAGLGAVLGFSASPYRDGGTRHDILPLYLYEGDRLFLDANRAGVKLLKGTDYRLDVFAAQRLEGFPTDNLPDSLSGMTMRRNGVDLGLSWHSQQPWGALQVDFLHDVDSASRGNELRLGYGYAWRSGDLTLRPNLTLGLRDAKLNNYYYGVTAAEATPNRPAYAPGAGLNTTLALDARYELTQRWRLVGRVSATVLSSKVADSPIVQKRVLPAVYVGAAYDFGAPQRSWSDKSTPTYFKLLYGKATEDGCHLAKILTAQCLSTASTNPTNIVGLQIGKPFVENFNGWPIDLMGYVGVTHHNDRGLQPNGLQLDLFMKAVYSGFPWSHRVKTRLGFGAGVSAAQRSPYIEASSLAAEGKTSSRLLQYLDPTLDVSLGDLIGSRALKDTYIGFGVSHRSGIFGASRLLGNVSGGSNYIYTYVESAL